MLIYEYLSNLLKNVNNQKDDEFSIFSQKFMPMLDIFKMNDHESAKIDYLKMDVEGAEITGKYNERGFPIKYSILF